MNPSRKFIDFLVSSMGLVAVVGLIIAGSLAWWMNSYTSTQVHNQLASQQITFPAKNMVYPLAPAGSEDYGSQYAPVAQYAGQLLTTGDQARVYANVQLQNDLNAIAGGKTYSQLSAASRADPTNTKLTGLVATVFKGTTLKGLLLNAYAFGTMATIAGWAAIVAFVGAALLLILSILGFLHGAGKFRVRPAETTTT
jgi:hypothetical protein